MIHESVPSKRLLFVEYEYCGAATPYKNPEHPCDLRRSGQDTRLFTSSHTMELLRYGGSSTPPGLNETKGYPNHLNMAVVSRIGTTLSKPRPHTERA